MPLYFVSMLLFECIVLLVAGQNIPQASLDLSANAFSLRGFIQDKWFVTMFFADAEKNKTMF